MRTQPHIVRSAALLVALSLAAAAPSAQERGAPPPGRGAGAPPPSPRAGAPVDLTGNWVSLITEDWRHRHLHAAEGRLCSGLRQPAGAEGRR